MPQALPPEPLDDVLPRAARVVVGEVVRVDDEGAWPAGAGGAPIDGAPPRPAQRATLRVERVLRGPPDTTGTSGATLDVQKPAGAYALVPGVRGAFLVDASGALLGRYGPDTWSVDEVEASTGPGGPEGAGGDA